MSGTLGTKNIPFSSSFSPSKLKSDFTVKHERLTHPIADVISANILVECIRLSGGKNVVERCEKLWYNDKNNNINLNIKSNTLSVIQTNKIEIIEKISQINKSDKLDNTKIIKNESVKNVDEEKNGNKNPRGIYPNDYTFELMSKIWVEGKCKDIAIRSQSLFDRYV